MRIRFAKPVAKDAGDQILPEGNYLCSVVGIKESESKRTDDDGNKKQLLLVTFKVFEGDYEGALVRSTYSMSDDIGRARFADFYQAIDPQWPGEGLEEIETKEVVGKKIYLDVAPREYMAVDDDGNKEKRTINNIKKNGYATFEGENEDKSKKGSKKSSPKNSKKKDDVKVSSKKASKKAKDEDADEAEGADDSDSSDDSDDDSDDDWADDD